MYLTIISTSIAVTMMLLLIISNIVDNKTLKSMKYHLMDKQDRYEIICRDIYN